MKTWEVNFLYRGRRIAGITVHSPTPKGALSAAVASRTANIPRKDVPLTVYTNIQSGTWHARSVRDPELPPRPADPVPELPLPDEDYTEWPAMMRSKTNSVP